MGGMRYQPQGILRINRASAFARGLRLASLPGVSAADAVSGLAGTVIGTRRATYPGGYACAFGSTLGGGASDRIATPLDGSIPSERTYFVLARRNGNGGANVGRLFDKSQGTTGQMAYWENGTQSFAYHVFANGWSERIIRAPAGQAAAVGRDFALVITHAAVGGRTAVGIHVNGELATSQETDGGLTDAPAMQLNIGNRWDGARGWDGTIAAVNVWDRLLTPQEIRDLSNNPWQIFAAFDDDDYSAAAVNRALQVERAQLALAGGQVGMRVSRRLRAESGVLALAGGQVSAHVARRMEVRPTALTAGAGQAKMLASRRLGVQSAALAVAGQDVVMRAGRRMVVAPVALGLAGGDVALQYGPTLKPGEYTIQVSPAAMQLGGGNVGMRVARRLAVTPAALVVAAGSARALVGRRLVVSPAALSLSAGRAGAQAARRVRVQAGQLVVTGGSVQLRYSSQIEYARAPAGTGYSPQRVAVTARPAQTGGRRPPAIQETIR